MTLPNMHDSGKRESFESGAVRDTAEGKPRPDLISPHANLREGAWLARGAEKYKERNWEAGIPISRCIASLERHIADYKLGLTNEDNMAAIRTNAGFILHFEEEIKAGRMDSAIDDMPHYDSQVQKFPTVQFSTPISWKEDGESASYYPRFHCNLCGYDGRAVEINGRIRLLKDIDMKNRIGVRCPHCYLPSARKQAASIERRQPTFYICGPMRNRPQLNFPMFDRIADQARAQGWNVINPADLDRDHGIDPINDPDSVDRVASQDPDFVQTIVQRDIGEILTLNPNHGDGLILLPDWEKSTGARAEVAIALWLELAIKTWYVDKIFRPRTHDEIKYLLFNQPNKKRRS